MHLVDQADLLSDSATGPTDALTVGERRREAAREKHLRAMIVAILLG